MRSKISTAAFLCLSLTFAAPAFSGERGAEPGNFDFYVLSLSWSPSYCETEGANANRQQCADDISQPYTFIVHGLWPQYESGYPEFCPSEQPARVPERLVEQYTDIMPSAGLIGHQWRKHGSCSGLPQAYYFALVRQARDMITIPSDLEQFDSEQRVTPEEVEEKFTEANPGLNSDDMAVTCERHFLQEVRICLTPDLDFRSCEEVDRDSCQRSTVLMPPA